MGKLVMWNLLTLDGMFEGAQPWDLGSLVLRDQPTAIASP